MRVQTLEPIINNIVQSAPWWQSWLPVLGSLIIAGVTWRATSKSNTTNNAAIVAADNREHDKWRRDTILPLVAEILEISRRMNQSATDGFKGLKIDAATYKGEWSQPDEIADQKELNGRQQRELTTKIKQLELIAGSDLIAALNRMRDAHVRLRGEVWFDEVTQDDLGSPMTNRKKRFDLIDSEVVAATQADLNVTVPPTRAALTSNPPK